MSEKKCGICDVVLTTENTAPLSPMHFIYTCKDHAEHANCSMPDVIKKRLGFITEYQDRMKVCAICDADLSPEEIAGIKETDVRTTCRLHAEVRNVLQDMGKDWFKFKASVDVNAKLDNADSMKKFHEWKAQQKH